MNLNNEMLSHALPFIHTHRNSRKSTMILLLIVAALLAGVVIAGFLLRQSALEVDFSATDLSPSLEHLFGTDWLGRDMFVRTLAGLSLSVFVGLVAACISTIMAVILGIAAALGGKKADAVIGWFIDLSLGLPHIIFLILIAVAIGKGFWGVVIGVGLTHWPSLARVVRGEILQLKNASYIQIAGKLGQSKWKIALRHLLPHILPQFMVGFVLLFPHAILHEAAITFLGFGLSAEQPAIGIILAESMKYLSTGMWWLAVFPGAALVVIVLLFYGAGNSLRRLVEPIAHQQKGGNL